MSTRKITVQGGFHNVHPITLLIRNDRMSLGQYRRLDKHMCGIQGCTCHWLGFRVEGISRDEFLELKQEAEYQKYSA